MAAAETWVDALHGSLLSYNHWLLKIARLRSLALLFHRLARWSGRIESRR
jgi:hypothetical protein